MARAYRYQRYAQRFLNTCDCKTILFCTEGCGNYYVIKYVILWVFKHKHVPCVLTWELFYTHQLCELVSCSYKNCHSCQRQLLKHCASGFSSPSETIIHEPLLQTQLA